MSDDSGFYSKELWRQKVGESFTSKIDCKNYWNAHGKRIEWEPTSYRYPAPVKVELYRVCEQLVCKYMEPQILYYLLLYVNGSKLDCGDIVQCRFLKTKVALDCCIGSG